jgi:predicted nuclease with TOPRIM domain
MDPTLFATHVADGARRGRERTLGAMRSLEAALARPASTREEEWAALVHNMLVELQAAVSEAHARRSGCADLLNELVDQHPRFLRRVARLQKDYEVLQGRLKHLLQSFSNSSRSDEAVEALRSQTASMLNDIRRVQARETELIHEAWQVDIGNGD